MTKVLDNTGLGYLITKMKAAFWPKADVVTVTLADVATTGSYNDLSNKPTIPTVPTISTDISADATSDTKTASPKAVKTFVENKGYTTNTGTVTGVTVGTTAYSPSSGVVTIPAYPSVPVTDVTVGGSSVLSSGTAVIPAIPTVPTISTDVVTDKASDTKTSSPKSVYAEIHPAVVSSQPAGGMLPNVMYDLGALSGNTTFSLATPADANVVNHYFWTFDTPSTAPTITWPNAITSWYGGEAPTINASKHYEVSLLDGVAICMEV